MPADDDVLPPLLESEVRFRPVHVLIGVAGSQLFSKN